MEILCIFLQHAIGWLHTVQVRHVAGLMSTCGAAASCIMHVFKSTHTYNIIASVWYAYDESTTLVCI